MYRSFFKQLKRLFFCALLFCALPAGAQQPADSVKPDTSEEAISENSSPIKGEYEAPAQEAPRNTQTPTNAEWNRIVSDPAYSYRDKREFTVKTKPPEEDSFFIRVILAIFRFFGSVLGKTLLWISLGLIVAYIAYRLISGQGGGLFAKRDRAVPEEEETLSEQNLAGADWEAQMQSALKAGDVRGAIRFSYLRVLQLLQERGYILYSPDKTDMAYYRELGDRPQRQAFRTIMRQYEWAWYGNFPPAKDELEQYLKTFQSLKQSLGTV